jgi:1-deoxy-D-xylulose-5-phosphate synthase
LRDEYAPHGDPARLLSMQGLDATGIEASIRARFGELAERAAPGLKVVG